MKVASYGRRGFTLIELLIVVAIIAILAAIAVPNFLEAQTRSKISRTMSDMRSVGVALEVYATDYGTYPMTRFTQGAYAGWLMIHGDINVGSDGYIGSRLTTPIGYMSRLPTDYFNSRMMLGRNIDYNLGYSFWTDILKPGMSNYRTRDFENWFALMRSHLGSLFPEHPNWVLESCGPNLMWWGGQGLGNLTPDAYLYDPTNGTISHGMISHSDQGWIAPRK